MRLAQESRGGDAVAASCCVSEKHPGPVQRKGLKKHQLTDPAAVWCDGEVLDGVDQEVQFFFD